MTRILISSASGVNGDGYGAVLSFAADGALAGSFSQDRRITDPRGLGLGPSSELVYLNSGDDRVLALDRHGRVALDSGRIDGLDPGGGTFGPNEPLLSLSACPVDRTIFALPAFFEQGGIPVRLQQCRPPPTGVRLRTRR